MRWRKESSDEEPFDFEVSETETYEKPEQPQKVISPVQPPSPVSTRRRRARFDEEEEAPSKKVRSKLSSHLELRWVRNHWKTIIILLFLFGFALFVRGYYGWEPATEDGYLLSGGSDSYYHNYARMPRTTDRGPT